MITKRIEEFEIDQATSDAIHELLRESFEEYPRARTYYKQVPTFRYLVYDNAILTGHLAVEHRMINVGGEPSCIFGVADLCVRDGYQDQKIASNLLEALETLGKKHQIDFIVLIAQNHQLYQNNGYQLSTNTCRWLMINEHQTLGVNHRNIDDCLMIKPLQNKQWNQGLIDFLGHIF